MVIHIRWHEEERKNVNLLKNHNFLQNPFMSSVFLYDGKIYHCGPHQQVLLYLFFYGLNPGKFNKLIKIPTGNLVEILPDINLFRVFYWISKVEGLKEEDEYTWVLNKIYEEAVRDRIPFIYDQYSARDTDINWLKEKIFECFPSIIKELHQSYPKIRLFL